MYGYFKKFEKVRIKLCKKLGWASLKNMFLDGWMDVKAVLRIAYSNQTFSRFTGKIYPKY